MKKTRSKLILPAIALIALIVTLGLGGMQKAVFAAQATLQGVDDRPAAVETPGGGEVEITGIVNSIDAGALVVDGKTIQLAGAEVKGILRAGDLVKVHLRTNADGSLAAREVERVGAADDRVDDNGGDRGSDDDRVDTRGGLDDVQADDHGGSSGSDDMQADDHGGSSGSDDVQADDHGGDDSGSHHSGGDDAHDDDHGSSHHGGRDD